MVGHWFILSIKQVCVVQDEEDVLFLFGHGHCLLRFPARLCVYAAGRFGHGNGGWPHAWYSTCRCGQGGRLPLGCSCRICCGRWFRITWFRPPYRASADLGPCRVESSVRHRMSNRSRQFQIQGRSLRIRRGGSRRRPSRLGESGPSLRQTCL